MENKRNVAVQVVPPEDAAVTIGLGSIKGRMGIYHNLNDETLYDCLRSAVAFFEEETGMCVMSQTWEEWYDVLAENKLKPTRQPLQSVSQALYFVDDDDVTGLAFADYMLPVKHVPGQNFSRSRFSLYPKSGWPPLRDIAGFKLKYVAGYGDKAEEIPANLKNGLWEMMAYLYENPGSASLLERGPDSRFAVRDFPVPTQKFIQQFKEIKLAL